MHIIYAYRATNDANLLLVIDCVKKLEKTIDKDDLTLTNMSGNPVTLDFGRHYSTDSTKFETLAFKNIFMMNTFQYSWNVPAYLLSLRY